MIAKYCPFAAEIKYDCHELPHMSSIELTPSQRSILSALVNLYTEQEDAVKGEDIADEINRTPGTIRNQMQSLKALKLVEGVPGPKGGYKPTSEAFDVLEIQQVDDPAWVRLSREGEILDDVNVVQIQLASVHHPDLCRAEVQVRGSLRNLHEGDFVTVGPTPLYKMKVEGTVDGKDESNNTLILSLDRIQAPVDD